MVQRPWERAWRPLRGLGQKRQMGRVYAHRYSGRGDDPTKKHADLSQATPADVNRPGKMHSGDLMLCGSSTVVVFYKTFRSYSPALDRALELRLHSTIRHKPFQPHTAASPRQRWSVDGGDRPLLCIDQPDTQKWGNAAITLWRRRSNLSSSRIESRGRSGITSISVSYLARYA